jgi:hypothetical protein
LHCYECNSIICGKCRLQGRYRDELEYYCFDCRKFSVHKNSSYYFNNDKYKFDAYDDWQDASWYY